MLIYAPDETDRSRLAAILTRAGHEVVAAVGEADVVLAVGDWPTIAGAAVVTLGGTRADHAGSLGHDATPEQIDAALRAASAGLVVCSASASEGGFASMKENALRALLTPRELEVVDAMRQGLTNKMIARRLGISLHTVKFHVESVFRKLGVRTRAEAVATALERQRRERIEL